MATHKSKPLMTAWINPLFAREFRARWRDQRAWFLLLGLVFALALLAYILFRDASWNSNGPFWNGRRYVQLTPSARSAFAGRQLFAALSLGNLVAWLLVAPLLAATPIARERERGLLESLQLSRLSPLSQIAARFGAALLFLLVLQGAILPIYGLVFWLGGVSPGELGRAALLIASTALGGVALGTWISARSPRPAGALFSALGTVVLWALMIPVALIAISELPLGWQWPANIVLWTHPLPQIFALTDTSGQVGRAFFPPFDLDLEEWMNWCFAGWALATLVLLIIARRLVARELPPSSWGPQASAPVEWWRRSLLRRQTRAAERDAERQKQRRRVGHRVEGALMADLPFEKLVRFSDPLLAREVRSRFRLRRGNWMILLGRFALLAVGVAVWMWAVYALLDAPSRASVGDALIYVLWGLGTLSIGALAASSFVRERESGTWEGLKLSLIEPPHITRVKWLSPLISFFYYSAPLWMLLPFSMGWRGGAGVEPLRLLLALGILVCALGTVCILGLVISWRAKTPTAALGWTLGLAALALIGVPIVRAVSGFDDWLVRTFYGISIYSNDSAPTSEGAANLQWLVSLWHPVSALSYALSPQTRTGYQLTPPTLAPWVALAFQAAICVVAVGVGFWWLARAMRRENERVG